MECKIRKLSWEGAEEYASILKGNPAVFAFDDPYEVEATRLDSYEVVGEDQSPIAYFSLTHYYQDGACPPTDVLCGVFVKEPYRGKGIFSKIVEFVKGIVPADTRIEINAEKGNETANAIYQSHFHYICGYDDANYYVIRYEKGHYDEQ